MPTPLEITVLSWLKDHPFVLKHRLDQGILTLIELSSQKQISLKLTSISDHRVAQNAQGFGTYMNLVLENGSELILCHAGLAFSPNFQNTGPIHDAPPVICMSDYQKLKTNLEILMKEPDRKLEVLTLFNLLLAILDGAKVVGMDVNLDEEQLEKQLQDFESTFS